MNKFYLNKSDLHKIGAGIFAAAGLAALAGSAPVQAAGPERSLAGVAIFAPGSVVTKKFGNPNQILVGGVAPPPFSPAGASGGMGGPGGGQGGYPGGQGAPGGQGGYPGSQSSISGSQGGFPGGGSPFGEGGTGSLPGFPGLGATSGSYPGAGGGGFPGAGGFPGGSSSGFPGGASGFPGSAATVAPIKPPYTYIYNRANGGSLEFTISPDKRVVQIRETGYLGAYGTARGIKLGTTYAAVIARYGSPEDISIAGPIINIDYRSTLHCGFQFLDQKLVGIVVSSPD